MLALSQQGKSGAHVELGVRNKSGSQCWAAVTILLLMSMPEKSRALAVLLQWAQREAGAELLLLQSGGTLAASAAPAAVPAAASCLAAFQTERAGQGGVSMPLLRATLAVLQRCSAELRATLALAVSGHALCQSSVYIHKSTELAQLVLLTGCCLVPQDSSEVAEKCASEALQAALSAAEQAALHFSQPDSAAPWLSALTHLRCSNCNEKRRLPRDSCSGITQLAMPEEGAGPVELNLALMLYRHLHRSEVRQVDCSCPSGPDSQSSSVTRVSHTATQSDVRVPGSFILFLQRQGQHGFDGRPVQVPASLSIVMGGGAIAVCQLVATGTGNGKHWTGTSSAPSHAAWMLHNDSQVTGLTHSSASLEHQSAVFFVYVRTGSGSTGSSQPVWGPGSAGQPSPADELAKAAMERASMLAAWGVTEG
jgi:hypothetical protein